MKSYRENPEGEENQRATLKIEREVGGLKLEASWRNLAMRLADEATEVLDNAHWEVKHGSGDLLTSIKSVREKYRNETQLPPTAKETDAHCLACGFKMNGGANVGLCPKCGSDRWYKTRL